MAAIGGAQATGEKDKQRKPTLELNPYIPGPDGSIKFQPGFYYAYEGRIVALLGVEGDQCTIIDPVSHEEIDTKIDRLSIPERSKKLKATFTISSKVSEDEWARAGKIQNAIKDLQSDAPEKTLEAHAKALSMSVDTFREWQRKYLINPRRSSLLRGARGPKFGSKRLKKAIELIVDSVLKTAKSSKEAISYQKIADDIRRKCEKGGHKVPSKKAIVARIEAAGIDLGVRRRLGPKIGREREEPKTGTYDPGRPLAEIQVDHTRVDIFVVDDESRVCIGRPWLTLVICSKSRVVMGYYLSFEAPSMVSVAMALLCACAPKYELLKTLKLEDLEWPIWGKPKSVLTDNAVEFKCEAFTQGCKENDIEVKYRPLGRKNWGGRVEALIGKVMHQVHMLPGTTFSNPKAKKDYDSEGHATLSLTELERWLVASIVEHNNTPHGANDWTPMHEWKHGLSDDKGVYHAPGLIPGGEAFYLSYLPRATRDVTPSGVKFKKNWYKAPVVYRASKAKKLRFAYDPRKPRAIYVTFNGDHYKIATKTPGVLLPHSYSKEIRAAKRALGLSPESVAMRNAANDRKAAILDHAKKTTRKANRAYVDPPTQAPPPPPNTSVRADPIKPFIPSRIFGGRLQ